MNDYYSKLENLKFYKNYLKDNADDGKKDIKFIKKLFFNMLLSSIYWMYKYDWFDAINFTEYDSRIFIPLFFFNNSTINKSPEEQKITKESFKKIFKTVKIIIDKEMK